MSASPLKPLRRILVLPVILLVGTSLPAADLIPLGSTARVFKGTAEASSPNPAGWRTVDFSDSAWTVMATPLWYGDGQTGVGTELTDMFGNYSTVFLRQTFLLTNVADVGALQLGAQSDDGFIAWINGTQVARFNVPDGEISYDGFSLPALPEPIPFERVDIPDPRSFLVTGANVLAVQALNSSLAASSDFVIDVSLTATADTTAPTVESLIPPATATVRDLTAIEVLFSEAVSGVDAGDLLVNGQPSTDLVQFNDRQYEFSFAQPAPGPVQVAWKPDHGIRDLAGNPNLFGGGNWAYVLDPDATPPGMVLSEFMADNDRTLNDEDGDASDWIEIRNAGTETVSLNGWFLTDDSTHADRWRIPNVSLPPEGYLLLFASGKNRTNPTATLHTDFRLGRDGGYLALLDPQGGVVSGFSAYPPQLEDVSYGLDRIAVDLAGYFSVPTPGSPNSIRGAGFSPEVTFSRGGGTFSSAFTLSLGAADTNAVIRYTLDGTLPGPGSAAYSAPIPVSTTTQVRARTFTPGLLPGPPRSESFVLLHANVLNFTSDLPLLVIHNFGAGAVPANQDQFAYVALFEPGLQGTSSLTNTPSLSARSGINIRGSSTQGYPKSSFAVEWWDEFDSDLDLSPLGLPAESDWVLYAPNNFEPIMTHNPFIFELSNQIGRYAPRTRFVEVYLNTSGGVLSSANYNGIYVLMEKIKRGGDRVNVANLQPEHLAPPQVTGGYVMKIDRLDPGDSGFFAAGQSIAYVDPKEEEIELPQRAPQRQYLQNYMNAFGNALNSAGFTNPVTGYRAYVDTGAWIDHHILNVMAFNVDALRLSAYFSKDRGGRLSFGPIWDFDRALGSTDGRDANPRVWRSEVPDYGTDFFNYPWWGRMFRDPDFWQQWIDRWQELRSGPLSLTNMNALQDALSGQIRLAQPRERARWGVQPRGGSYQSEINFTKNWLASRVNFMDTNFLARPGLSRPEGPVSAGQTVTLSGPAGATLYYTLDGTDPRLSGGAISPRAIVYTGPVTLNNNARLAARARNPAHANLTGPDKPPLSTPWSGLSAATYVVATPPLILTEIMYHPASPPPGNTNDSGNFEFVELMNRGQAAINLVGVRFTNGIDFTFTTNSAVTTLQPGGRVVIVKNQAAFASRYPSVTAVVGEYTGSLDNSGERISLVGSLLEPIHDFRFENRWHPITDGPGFSLVLVDENAPLTAWGSPSAWRPGSVEGGTPGSPDSAPSQIPPIRVNEALTHTDPPQVDAIELYNPTGASVDLGGWYLTDNLDKPRKFRIPAGTAISAGGYRVFLESDFNNGTDQAFALSSLGDAVYLFSGNASSNLTGYLHGFQFGPSVNGVSFGRHVTSTTEEHFVAQQSNTLGAGNSGPRVGPVVINEIMYCPPFIGTNNNSIDEYIELRNITAQSVPLYDPLVPANTWRVEGGVQFAFPGGINVPPGGQVLLLNFDPVANTAQLAAFRERYPVGANALLLGPYSGLLNNSGEAIDLMRPDTPQTIPDPFIGFVPYVLVERVEYSSSAPWPTHAFGTGNSIRRRFDAAYGNDPANWSAEPPTPGSPNADTGGGDSDQDGLPDDWESSNGLDPFDSTGVNGASGDPDGDGMTNLQEFLSGTHPGNSSSVLRIEVVEITESTIALRFQALAGRTYTLQRRDAPGSGPWTTVTNVPAAGTDRMIEVPEGIGAGPGARFYRLATP